MVIPEHYTFSQPETTILYENSIIIDWIHSRAKDQEMIAIFYDEKSEFHTYKQLKNYPHIIFPNTIQSFPKYKDIILNITKDFLLRVAKKHKTI